MGKKAAAQMRLFSAGQEHGLLWNSVPNYPDSRGSRRVVQIYPDVVWQMSCCPFNFPSCKNPALIFRTYGCILPWCKWSCACTNFNTVHDYWDQLRPGGVINAQPNVQTPFGSLHLHKRRMDQFTLVSKSNWQPTVFPVSASFENMRTERNLTNIFKRFISF